MKKIVLAGFPNVSNFGDPVLFESAEYLIKSIVNDSNVKIVHLDLFGENKTSLSSYFSRGVNKIFNTIFNNKDKRNSEFYYRLQKTIIELAVKKYYNSIIVDADAIVFVGGGMFKYKYETCDFRLSILTERAKKTDIPVAFNAVGVEGYDQNNVRCINMKKAINLDNVKSITTRDDIDLLNNKHINNPKIYTEKVADSAFWSNNVYDISKNTSSNIVGLGVVRGGIFQDNGISLREDQLLDLWVGIINELESRNLKWQLFTNGLDSDNEFLNLLLINIDRIDEKEKLARIPKTSKELIEIISNYKKVIACRMHASIISYSLDIPSVGLIWNDKIKMFGETIGHPDRFFRYQDFDPKAIVDKLIDLEISKKDIEFKNNFRETTLKSLEHFINSIDI